MVKYAKKIVSLLLVFVLFSGQLAGCSNSKTVSADLDQKLELAIKYLSEHKYEQAVLAYQEVIKIDSKNLTAYKGISLAYIMQKKPGEAEKALQDGLKALSNNEQLQLAMAGLMLDQDKGDQAEAIYKELINSDSPNLSTYQAYTQYLSKQGKQAEAIALLEQAVTKNSKDYKLNSMLAELYFKNGDRDKALAVINKSLEQQLDQSTSYKLLAEMYKDQWAELIFLGDQYIQQNQASTGQLIKLSALLSMGKYEDLIKLYGELAKDLKNNPRVRFIAAQAYSKLGKKDQSFEITKQIKIADMKDAGMLADLAAFYLENGDKDHARKIALQGIAADNTVIENYAVMYKSYAGEDKNLAQILAYRYMLASSLSYKGMLSKLAEYEIADGSQKQSEGEIASKEIVEAIIRDKALGKNHPEWPHMSSEVYLDTKNNIAYKGYSEKATNWKPVIVRYHSPTLYSKENIPADIIDNIKRNYSGTASHWQKFNASNKFILAHGNSPKGKIDWAYAVIMEGDIPFEEHLKRAGYPNENITFIDI